jgi:hypothetical protein
MVGGRKNTKTTTSEENFQVLYPDWIHGLLEGRDIHIISQLMKREILELQRN